MHPNIVEFKVTGSYALFSDPLMRMGGEKSTYQVPTYEALKGIIMSVYWKPTIIWYIDKVRVMKQIQTEVKGIRPIKFSHGIKEAGNDLSYYTYLKDVEYQVQAHFEWNLNRPELANDRNENKHHNIAKRMIAKGGRRDVFLGTRECQAYVEPCIFGEGASVYDTVPEIAMGVMLHGVTYADEAYSEDTKGWLSTRFWRPVMRNGIIKFIRPEECELVKKLHPMDIKVFSNEKANFIGLNEFEEVN